MTTPIQLSGHGFAHRTQTKSGRKVVQLHFMAAADFEHGDHDYRAGHFDPCFFGAPLYDWNGLTEPMAARDYGIRQALTITVNTNAAGYWELLSIDELGRVQLEPKARFCARALEPFLDRPTFPALALAQVRAALAYKKSSPFDLPKPCSWASETGRWADLLAC